MKRFLLFIFVCLLSKHLAAQDFDYGKYDGVAMDMTKYDKDTSAHAVVIREFGKAWISTDDGLPLHFEYHVKIKIFDSKAFDRGDVEISLYKSDSERFEQVEDIVGTTFYKDENGAMQQSNLDRKKIIYEDVDRHHQLVKFALPNLRKGCVIEYKYSVVTPYHYLNFHSWHFQSAIPKIYSEYEAHIPAIYEYNVSMRGALKLSVNKPELERECFSYYGLKCDCTKMRLGMNDIPAFIEEADMTSPANFLSAVYFELTQSTDQNGIKHQLTKAWPDIDHELKTNDDFGSQFKRKSLYKEALIPVIGNLTDSLQKAKAVYAYIQHWFKWNKDYGMFTDNGIKKAIDSHSGNSAEINFALIAALSAAGVTAEAVILSTRENGLINKLYPVISDFDYVVAKADIGGKSYLLDATDPLLPFGLLPLRCINDQGRVISLDKPSYWINMVATQKRRRTTTVDLTLQDNGKLKGTITTFSMGYAGYEKRRAIKKYNTVDEYVENLSNQFQRVKILKSEILNVDSIDKPLTEKYEVEINAYDNLNHDKLAFNPSYWEHVAVNPFKLTERTYPVDMGSASDDNMVVSLLFPANFEIVQQPAPVAMALPNGGGKFITDISADAGIVRYSQLEQFSRAVYSADEYPYIKELYNKMIQNQKADIVFRKKQ